MQKNKLTDLEISEVSFVDKGAIGEVFSIIKMEDPDNPNLEVIKAYDSSQVCETLSKIPDKEFVAVMDNMMSRYKEINKGGTEMNEEQIKEIVKSVVDATMETVNKNFVKVNNSIDEIQKAVKAQVDEKAQAQAEADQKKKDEEAGAVKKSLEDVTKSVSEIEKALDTVAKMKESVDGISKINDTLADISKRLEKVESLENPSNTLDKDDVTKNAGGEGVKTPFWKSILGDPNQE